MKIHGKEYDLTEIRKSIICITAGTGSGLLVYGIFLYFHIDIYGWNLGLIFAPLAAGYVETIIANRLIGENLGAISAFILFIDTTFYSFILKNPTLGFNLITAGSILVILQAAFPTLVNFIILVVVGGIISKFINTIKRFARKAYIFIKLHQPFHWEGKNIEIPVEPVPVFNEDESNRKLNSLDFYFMTSSDINNEEHDIIGLFHNEVIIDKDKHIIKLDPEKKEQQALVSIKNAKDECLIKLANSVKENGGNGILDLTINYSLIGLNGDNIQITAMGMGIIVR